jgi:hypothetical protein
MLEIAFFHFSFPLVLGFRHFDKMLPGVINADTDFPRIFFVVLFFPIGKSYASSELLVSQILTTMCQNVSS